MCSSPENQNQQSNQHSSRRHQPQTRPRDRTRSGIEFESKYEPESQSESETKPEHRPGPHQKPEPQAKSYGVCRVSERLLEMGTNQAEGGGGGRQRNSSTQHSVRCVCGRVQWDELSNKHIHNYILYISYQCLYLYIII